MLTAVISYFKSIYHSCRGLRRISCHRANAQRTYACKEQHNSTFEERRVHSMISWHGVMRACLLASKSRKRVWTFKERCWERVICKSYMSWILYRSVIIEASKVDGQVFVKDMWGYVAHGIEIWYGVGVRARPWRVPELIENTILSLACVGWVENWTENSLTWSWSRRNRCRGGAFHCLCLI